MFITCSIPFNIDQKHIFLAQFKSAFGIILCFFWSIFYVLMRTFLCAEFTCQKHISAVDEGRELLDYSELSTDNGFTDNEFTDNEFTDNEFTDNRFINNEIDNIHTTSLFKTKEHAIQ